MELQTDRRGGIAGADFEHTVVELLQELGRQSGAVGFRVEHQEPIHTPDGTYRIDVTVRFELFGAEFLVLGECKEHARPIEREDVQILADRMRASRAQKGMFFSTNGFQRGAVEYARVHHIALVQIIEGAATWFTRAAPTGARIQPYPWTNVPAFVGQLVSLADNGNVVKAILEPGEVGPLVRFAASA